MNKKILLPFKQWATFSLISFAFLFWNTPSQAQAPALAGPNFGDQIAGSSGLATVNTAMIECPGIGGFLSAVIWGDAVGTNLYLTHTGGQTLTLPISNAASSSQPDVILGDDPNNPGVDYIAVVCYQDNNGDVIVENYEITDIAGPSMMAGWISSQDLGAGSDPKIDGFANNNTLIAGLPAMDEFVVVWEKATLNDIGIYAGEVADVTNSFFQNTYTNAGINPDVAAVRDIVSNQLYACLYCYHFNSGSAISHVYDINLTMSPTPPPVITNLPGDHLFTRPRIEGMALYQKQAPKWNVVSFADFNSLLYFTNLNPTGSMYANPTGTNYAAAIAAGPGPFVIPYSPSAIIGNRQITLAWAGKPYASSAPSVVVSAAFDTSNIAPKYFLPPFYLSMMYQYATVNMYPINAVNVDTDEYEVAIAACCNSGKRLITAWWNGIQGTVRYKITPGNDYAFKPTGLQELAQAALSFSVFPNPTAKTLHIKYSGFAIQKIRITDALGKKVQEMSYKDAPVDISTLPAGDYFISITTGDNAVMTRPLVIAR